MFSNILQLILTQDTSWTPLLSSWGVIMREASLFTPCRSPGALNVRFFFVS